MSASEPPVEARILDRRLGPVEARTGVASAMVAMAQHVLRRMLGLRRPARQKALPIIFIAMPYLPAIAFVGFAAIIPSQLAGEVLPTTVDFYGLIVTSMVLFTALVSPQALSPDRRHGTLGLLLASQLDRLTYLLAAGGALATVLLAVTLGPPLLVETGLALLGVEGPAVVTVLLRAAASGVVLATVFGAVGFAVASLTENRAFAAAGTFVTLLGLGIASEVVINALDWPAWARVIDVVALSLEVVTRINGEVGELAGVEGPVLGAAMVAWVAALLGLVWWRYRRMAVA